VSINIEIEGYDRLRRKLERLGKGVYFRGALTAAASDVKSWIAEYPETTSANEPRLYNSAYSISTGRAANSWYERGYGTRWARKDGTIGGSQTSETLGRRWTTRIAPDGRSATVGNNATYAPFVQDQDEQAWFHAARGWRTIQGAVRAKAKDVRRKFQDALRRALRE